MISSTVDLHRALVAFGLPAWCGAMAVALTLGTCACVADETAPARPLPQAHAHNDYEHPNPLLDALEQGFTSVEADVHLVDGELLVAHDADETNLDRTLRKLYLQPLLERVRAHEGRVYPQGPTITLLVDFRSAGAETYV